MVMVIRLLFRLLGPGIRWLPLMLLCFLCLSVVDMAGLTMLLPIMDILLSSHSSGSSIFGNRLDGPFNLLQDLSLLHLAMLLGVIFLAKSILTLAVQAIIVSYVQQQRVILGTKMLTQYLLADLDGKGSRREADQLYNLQTLTGHYTVAIQACLKIANDGLLGFALLIFLVLVDPVTFVVLITAMVLTLGIYLIVFRRSIVRYGRESNENMADALQISKEGVRGVDEIKFLGKQHYFTENYSQSLQRVKHASVGIELHAMVPRLLVELVVIFVLVAALLMQAFGVITIDNLIGVFGIYAIAAVRLVPIISSIASQILRFRAMQNSVVRLHDDLFVKEQTALKASDADVTIQNEQNFESLRFENVCFHYDKASPIISNLSLNIKRGDIVGLYGPSGVGKSTFVRLVLGLLAPISGTISLNGDVTGSTGKRSAIGMAYIPQDPVMLNRPVLENVTLSNKSDKETRDNANKHLSGAMLSDVMKSLPNGLDEFVGDFASRFSAGQRQRLAFARVLSHSKSFFVLDEATNALDMRTEETLLCELIRDGVIETALLVSHRPATLKHCNYILNFTSRGIIVVDNSAQFVAELEGASNDVE